MEFIICQKHRKVQKSCHKVTTTAQVCMNRYCNNCFKVICPSCKIEHRDHANKILTLEDITFLVERLLKTPFKELTCFIDDAVNAMKRLKLIKENRQRIDALEIEVQKQVLGLVDHTEELIHEYAVCKKVITELSDILANVETPKAYEEFKNASGSYLSNLDYNFHKDKFEYGNQSIREQFNKRKKSHESSKRKMEELKEYSMKIIEIILANDDSESDDEDIIYKKKYYEVLKAELLSSVKQKDGPQPELPNSAAKSIKSEIHESQEDVSIFGEEKQSKSTLANTSHCQKKNLSIEKSSQTDDAWLREIETTKKEFEQKIERMKLQQAKSENELKNKISALVREKEAMRKELSKVEEKYRLKNEKIAQVEEKLRRNKLKRDEVNAAKDDKIQKLIGISNWKALLEGDRVD